MGNLASNQSATPQNQPATPSQDPGDLALAILESAVSDGAEVETTEQKPQEIEGDAVAEESKPEEPAVVENPLAKARAAKEASQKGLQNQHAALTRRARELEQKQAEIETKRAEIESKRAELESIDDPEQLVNFLAKHRGKQTNEIWDDLVDIIKNGGKRSPTNKAVRVVEELRRDILGDREKTAKQQQEAEQQAQLEAVRQAEENWRSDLVTTAKKTADRWPTMARLPARALAAAAYDAANQHYLETGEVASYEDVLDDLESQAVADEDAQAPVKPQPAPATGNGGAKAQAAPKPKAKPISNSEASETPGVRVQSEEDREAAALRILQQSLA